jgi:AbrB family looped-hinge helix DNA binding protein
MRTTVSSRGQTAVPAEIRKRFRLTAHSRLEWIIDGDVITVLPIPKDPVTRFRGVLKGKYSAKALLEERAKERKRERESG